MHCPIYNRQRNVTILTGPSITSGNYNMSQPRNTG